MVCFFFLLNQHTEIRTVRGGVSICIVSVGLFRVTNHWGGRHNQWRCYFLIEKVHVIWKRNLWWHISKCKINYVDMQQKYVSMRDNYVDMQVFLYIYVLICVNFFTIARIWQLCGHSYSNMMHDVIIFKSHVDINMSHVDIDKSHFNCILRFINILRVYILMLHPAFSLLSETSSRSEFFIFKN